MNRRERVLEFHRAMGLPVAERPSVPSDDWVRLRLSLIAEEFFELLESSVSYSMSEARIYDARWKIEDWIRHGQVRICLPDLADALCDLDYVIEGCRLGFGIDGEPIEAVVHKANMAKVGGPVREDGKRLKPPGWEPPDIRAELVRQGWSE